MEIRRDYSSITKTWQFLKCQRMRDDRIVEWFHWNPTVLAKWYVQLVEGCDIMDVSVETQEGGVGDVSSLTSLSLL